MLHIGHGRVFVFVILAGLMQVLRYSCLSGFFQMGCILRVDADMRLCCGCTLLVMLSYRLYAVKDTAECAWRVLGDSNASMHPNGCESRSRKKMCSVAC